MVVLIEASPGLGIVARPDCLPISIVLRSDGSLYSEMLRLARTFNYVKYSSVLSINKSVEGSLDRKELSE